MNQTSFILVSPGNKNSIPKQRLFEVQTSTQKTKFLEYPCIQHNSTSERGTGLSASIERQGSPEQGDLEMVKNNSELNNGSPGFPQV